MDNTRTNKILIWILGLLLVGGLVFWAVDKTKHTPVDLTDTTLAEPAEGETSIVGSFVCLPFKNGQEITDDNCVLGLAGDDGKMYALDTTQITILSKTLEVKDHVRVVGAIAAPNKSISEGGAFQIDGVIQVRAIQKAPGL